MLWEEIWILRASLLTAACDVTTVKPIRKVGFSWRLLKQKVKTSVKSWDKTIWEVVSTCEVLCSAPAQLNTSKVTENRREDRSSQWEATKRSVGLSTARAVGAHRDRYQQHLICVNVRRMGPDGRYRNSDRHHNISMKVEVVWRQKSTKLWALSCLHSLAC